MDKSVLCNLENELFTFAKNVPCPLKESLVSFHGRENPAYFTKESRIEGEYTKFNNNWGYVNEKEYHSLLHAFSHWTWHVTGGFLQVNKFQ